MQIQLKKIKTTNPNTKEQGYTFRQVNVNTVSQHDIARALQQSGSLTQGDALNATVSLPEEIARALANNGKVVIEGFGTFSLSTTVGMTERAEDMKKSDVRFGINFQPSAAMLQIVRSAEVKVVKVSTTEDTTGNDNDNDNDNPSTDSGQQSGGGHEV